MTKAPAGTWRRALALSVVLAALALLAVAPRAEAAFSLDDLSAAPANPAAGANSDFVIGLSFPAGDDVKDLTIHLPPGQVGNPLATPLCTVDQLNAASCPANTQVGSVHTVVTIASIPAPQSVDGAIYNLTPQPGEPARFGIVLTPAVGSPIILQSAVKLRPTDFGLDSVLSNIPNSATVAPGVSLATHIDSMTVTLWGGGHGLAKPFGRNPTSCGPATTGFDADSYGGATASGSASYTPTDCAALDFSPTFTAKIGGPGATGAGSKPPLTTVVDQDPGEAGAEEVDVLLPKGVSASASQVSKECPPANFLAGACPASTVVGSATATSPFLSEPLSGPVTVVGSPGTGVPKLGLDLMGPLHIQLFGTFIIGARAGNSFVRLPDIPLTHFALTFAGGKLVAATRDLCTGSVPTFSTSFVGWNGATQSGNVAAQVQGCGGHGAKPKAKVRVNNAKSKKPHLVLVVKGHGTKVRGTKLRLPKRLHLAGSNKRIRHGLRVKGAHHASAYVQKRSLKLKTKPTGKLVEKLGRGALVRNRKIAHRKLHFKLAVTDAGGKITHLKLATKAKP